MISVTPDALMEYGFKMREQERDSSLLAFFRKGVTICLERIGGKYHLSEAKTPRKEYTERELGAVVSAFKDFENFIDFLDSPRWEGIPPEFRSEFSRLASISPKDYETGERKIDTLMRKINSIEDSSLRSRLEIELEVATTAHRKGEPKFYGENYSID